MVTGAIVFFFLLQYNQFLQHLLMSIWIPKQKEPLLIRAALAQLLSGVAEQFAIAEAKLRAWASMDEDDEDDLDSGESPINGQTHSSFCSSTGTDLFHLSFHFILLILDSLKQPPPRLIFQPPTPPPVHPSSGVLTLCSSLRRRHIQCYHTSATPA